MCRDKTWGLLSVFFLRVCNKSQVRRFELLGSKKCCKREVMRFCCKSQFQWKTLTQQIVKKCEEYLKNKTNVHFFIKIWSKSSDFLSWNQGMLRTDLDLLFKVTCFRTLTPEMRKNIRALQVEQFQKHRASFSLEFVLQMVDAWIISVYQQEKFWYWFAVIFLKSFHSHHFVPPFNLTDAECVNPDFKRHHLQKCLKKQ